MIDALILLAMMQMLLLLLLAHLCRCPVSVYPVTGNSWQAADAACSRGVAAPAAAAAAAVQHWQSWAGEARGRCPCGWRPDSGLLEHGRTLTLRKGAWNSIFGKSLKRGDKTSYCYFRYKFFLFILNLSFIKGNGGSCLQVHGKFSWFSSSFFEERQNTVFPGSPLIYMVLIFLVLISCCS